MRRTASHSLAVTLATCCLALLCACAAGGTTAGEDGSAEGSASSPASTIVVFDVDAADAPADDGDVTGEGDDTAAADATTSDDATTTTTTTDSLTAEEAWAALNITEDYRESFVHGEKPAEYQKYIVMHDTEGTGDAQSVINWWDSNGNLVAAHFIVNTDGSIVQCVPLDKIAHHAGFGDTGHNELYGVTDESRDDKLGTTPIGSWASDYGMNSYSIGIEMVHVGGSGDYPEAQLEAVDALIAYIDAYYGFESQIIDHKSWRTGNSDCSEEFQPYLENLQATRTHDGQ